MSYKYINPVNIEGIRKVKWDELWHVIYKSNDKETYDRVGRKTAFRILKQIAELTKIIEDFENQELYVTGINYPMIKDYWVC